MFLVIPDPNEIPLTQGNYRITESLTNARKYVEIVAKINLVTRVLILKMSEEHLLKLQVETIGYKTMDNGEVLPV